MLTTISVITGRPTETSNMTPMYSLFPMT